jgi:hypothetical protein
MPATVSRPLAVRLLAVPVVAAALVLGVWVTGGRITNDFKVAMGLTAAWMVLAGAVCVRVALKRRELRIPVLGAYLVTAAAIGVYLGGSVLKDKEVNERVATKGGSNASLASGRFESLAHDAVGTASTIELRGGRRVLTLTDFDVSAGPDLRVYLVAGPARDESEVDDHRDLGGLKGNRGNQQYDIPEDVDLTRYATVVIWCRAFSVAFARAPLAEG